MVGKIDSNGDGKVSREEYINQVFSSNRMFGGPVETAIDFARQEAFVRQIVVHLSGTLTTLAAAAASGAIRQPQAHHPRRWLALGIAPPARSTRQLRRQRRSSRS